MDPVEAISSSPVIDESSQNSQDKPKKGRPPGSQNKNKNNNQSQNQSQNPNEKHNGKRKRTRSNKDTASKKIKKPKNSAALPPLITE